MNVLTEIFTLGFSPLWRRVSEVERTLRTELHDAHRKQAHGRA